jgi:hypothetical protein
MVIEFQKGENKQKDSDIRDGKERKRIRKG